VSKLATNPNPFFALVIFQVKIPDFCLFSDFPMQVPVQDTPVHGWEE
jgi:hypothetical protein